MSRDTRPRAWQKTHNHVYGRRPYETKDERPRILIVCEGEKTEPLYFRSFHVTSANIEVYEGSGMHMSVVEKAHEMHVEDPDYEQVWCVFDLDSNPADSSHNSKFNNAVFAARGYGYNVAYTVDAFELWYLLHFHYFDTAITRGDYVAKLKNLVEGGYKKNRKDMYDSLGPKTTDAIRHAKRLEKTIDANNPAHANPSTTVHHLVEVLLKLSA